MTRHYSLARQLIEQGHEVTLVASSFHHHEKGEMLLKPDEYYRHEIYEGVHFVWIRGLPYNDNNGARRVLNMIHFGWKVFRETGLKELPRPDVVMGCRKRYFLNSVLVVIKIVHHIINVFLPKTSIIIFNR